MPSIALIFGCLMIFLSGVAVGIMIYHHVLGSTGMVGRFVAKKVEKKFKKIGKSIIDDDERKLNRGHALRNRSER